jgi:hypothetical protein
MAKDSIFLRAALTYAARGWSVFPLTPRDKKPLKGTKGVLDATTDEKTIRAWWTAQPFANVGIATGRSGLVVIDVDGPIGEAALVNWQRENDVLPFTVTAYTGQRGRHFLFRAPADVKIAPGVAIFGKNSQVDVRAAESYIAAPPSIHPNGNAYEWDKEAHPADMKPAELPAALLATLLTSTVRNVATQPNDIEPELVTDGQDAYGARQAAVLARKGFSKDEARAALSAMIESRFAGGWAGLDARRPWKAQDVERWLKGAYEKFYDPDGGDAPLDELQAINDLLGTLIVKQGVKQKTPGGTFTAADLQGETIAPIKWIVTDLLSEGVAIFGGKPKTGKSWLAIGLAIAIASDEPVFERPVVKGGEVLYLALEDNKRRLQSRLNKIMGRKPWPSRLHFEIDWPRGEDSVKKLAEWMDAHPETVLVIVDTLAKVKNPGGNDGYSEDYAIVSAYAKLTQDRQFSILIVTHQRKLGADDPIDTLQGTLGVSGAADTFYALTRQKLGADAVLYYRGREIESAELPLRWDGAAGVWVVREATGGNSTRARILAAFEAVLIDATPHEIAEAIGLSADTVSAAMRRMATDGLLRASAFGRYAVVEQTDKDEL